VEQQLLDLELAKRQLRLEAQTDGALLAERPAGNAAGESAQEHREVGHAVRDQAVREMAGDRAEGGAPYGPDEPEAEDGRGRLTGEVVRVLLDDGRIRFSHARSSSAAQAPFLSGTWVS
jgi:hypothetical protein